MSEAQQLWLLVGTLWCGLVGISSLVFWLEGRC